MLTIILILFAVILGVCFIIVYLQPEEFCISRSIVINAQPAVIFAHVVDLHQWENWSPWAKLDPNSKGTYEGPLQGVGASFSWSGNNQVGEGRMTIIESRPSDLVRLKLEFLKPMKAINMAEFTLTPLSQGTEVKWSMSGHNNFIGKAMGLFRLCDKLVGGQFETGLMQLKTSTEGKNP